MQGYYMAQYFVLQTDVLHGMNKNWNLPRWTPGVQWQINVLHVLLWPLHWEQILKEFFGITYPPPKKKKNACYRA